MQCSWCIHALIRTQYRINALDCYPLNGDKQGDTSSTLISCLHYLAATQQPRRYKILIIVVKCIDKSCFNGWSYKYKNVCGGVLVEPRFQHWKASSLLRANLRCNVEECNCHQQKFCREAQSNEYQWCTVSIKFSCHTVGANCNKREVLTLPVLEEWV